MKKLFAAITLVICGLIILNSCTVNNGSSTPTQIGAFLITQLSPDAPNLSVAINGNFFDSAIKFNTATPYITSNPGTLSFTITASGQTTPSDTAFVSIDPNKYYSFFLIDSFSKLKSAFVNDAFKAPSGDSVYIRFFNFCPNVNEPIDLYDSTHKVNLSATRSFNDQGFNPQYTAFNEVPAGNYLLSLKKTISGAVLKTQLITLSGGKVYTMVAKGFYGNADTVKALSIGVIQNYPPL